MRFLIFARCPWSCRCTINGPGPNWPPTPLAANIFRCCLQTDCSVNPIPVFMKWVTWKTILWNLVLTLRLCSYSSPSRRSMTNFGIAGQLDESLRWNNPTNGPMGIDMLLAALALRFRLWRPEIRDGKAINFRRTYRCVKKCWVMPTAPELCVACQRDRTKSMADPNIAHWCKNSSNGILGILRNVADRRAGFQTSLEGVLCWLLPAKMHSTIYACHVHAIPFFPATIKSRPNPRCHHISSRDWSAPPRQKLQTWAGGITCWRHWHIFEAFIPQNSDVQVFRRIMTANSRITGLSFFPRGGRFVAARLVSINGIHVYWWNCWGTSTAPCCYKARWQIWAWVWHIMCGYSVSILVAQRWQFRPQGSWSWNTINTFMRGALTPCW